MSFLVSLRKLAREAVIFTLLGPFLLLPVAFGYLTYDAPARAIYTKVPTCPSGALGKETCVLMAADSGASLVHGDDEPSWSNYGTAFLGGYATDESSTHRYVWLPGDKGIGRFDKYESDESIKRAISHDYRHAFKFSDSPVGETLDDSAVAALLFGWPLGLGIWFAYRLIRFAVKG